MRSSSPPIRCIGGRPATLQRRDNPNSLDIEQQYVLALGEVDLGDDRTITYPRVLPAYRYQ